MPNKNSKNRSTRRASSKPLGLYNDVIDRSRQLSDGTVGIKSDRYEFVPQKNSVPNRPPLNFTRQSYWYKGTYEAANITSNVSVPEYGAYSFQLSDLNQYGHFQAIFDQYAIVEVTARFTPCVTTAPSTSTFPGALLTVIDHDDAANVSAAATMQEYPSCLTTGGLVGHTRVIAPRVAIGAYTGTFAGFANQRSFIDTATPSVQHYGVKFFIQPSTGAAFSYNVVFDYIILFRDNH